MLEPWQFRCPRPSRVLPFWPPRRGCSSAPARKVERQGLDVIIQFVVRLGTAAHFTGGGELAGRPSAHGRNSHARTPARINATQVAGNVKRNSRPANDQVHELATPSKREHERDHCPEQQTVRATQQPFLRSPRGKMVQPILVPERRVFAGSLLARQPPLWSCSVASFIAAPLSPLDRQSRYCGRLGRARHTGIRSVMSRCARCVGRCHRHRFG